MIRRALIHISGPKSSGKTSFIEACLKISGPFTLCVRGERDNSLKAPKESVPKGHEELQRYKKAKASSVALYRFPESSVGTDDFFMSAAMREYSNVVLLEGDCPTDVADFFVFIAPPLPQGTSLLRRVQRDHTAAHLASLAQWEQSTNNDQDFLHLLTKQIGASLLSAAQPSANLLAELRQRSQKEITKLRAVGPPKPTEHWALTPGYEGIERAQLVVVNLREEGERPQAEKLLEELLRLRKDAAVFKDVLGWRGKKLPITAVATNLSNPKDPGSKKALARLKREIGASHE